MPQTMRAREVFAVPRETSQDTLGKWGDSYRVID